jgi:hypothetical protein
MRLICEFQSRMDGHPKLMRVCVPLLAGAIVFLSLPRQVLAQEMDKHLAPQNMAAVADPSATGEQDPPARGPNPTVSDLPDAPGAQGQDQTPQAASAPIPRNPLTILPRTMNAAPMDAEHKLRIYTLQTFGPPALIIPALTAGVEMLNPPSKYPRDWKDGGEAFGRLYGDRLARTTSLRTGRFLTQLVLHEDPRYMPSDSTNAFARTLHALAFTIVDKTDGGHNTIAMGNFVGAASGGFVGMAYLPPGYNDLTHAGQRAAVQFAGIAIGNIATEFSPQWLPLYKALHIPKILPPWWVPLHH